MSLSLVFAPAQVVEEMAEALPVCLGGREGQQSTTSLFQNKLNKVFKDFFFQKENCCHARQVNK